MKRGQRLCLFGVSRAHEWQIREMVRSGVEVYGWHLGGAGYLPSGVKALDFAKVEQFGEGGDVFFLHESHFVLAKAFSAAIGANFKGWTGEHHDKHSQRRALSDYAPYSFRFGRKEVLLNWTGDERFVVKPGIRSGGSTGVKIFSRSQYLDAIRHYEKLEMSGFDPIVETEIPGQEYCVDGFVDNGNVLWISIGKYFSKTEENLVHGILFGDVPSSTEKVIEAYSSEVLMNLGYSGGPFHIELRMVHERIFPIEIHGRFGGSIVTEATHRLFGESPFVGLKSPDPNASASGVVWAEFFYQDELTFAEARDFVFENSANGSFTAFPNLGEGNFGTSRIGYMTVEGRNLDELLKHRRGLLNAVKENHGVNVAFEHVSGVGFEHGLGDSPPLPLTRQSGRS